MYLERSERLSLSPGAWESAPRRKGGDAVALTDSSDFYGSFHEDGVNRIFEHVLAKRPSLFNYGTQLIADQWEKRLCCPIEVAPEVLDRGNPVVTVEQPLPIPGTGGVYSLNWAAQIADVKVDFYPSDIDLPKQLDGRLQRQQFALYARVCGGIGCPPDWVYSEFPAPPQEPIRIPGDDNVATFATARRRLDPITLPLEEGLSCFELEIYATGHAEVNGPVGFQVVELKLDGLEIVDIDPKGLENGLECYLEALVRFVVLPRLRVALPVFIFELPLGLGTVTLKAASAPANNPAIEDDQLKVFIDMEVA